jgi:hypothetical protein
MSLRCFVWLLLLVGSVQGGDEPHQCELTGDCGALDQLVSEHQAMRASRARLDDAHDSKANDSSTRTAVRIPLWTSEHERAEHCPSCPKTLLTFLDEPPRITAERACLDFSAEVTGRQGSSCVDTLERVVAERQLLRFMDLGSELDDFLRSEDVDMRSVEGRSFTYIEKLRLMRRLALHDSVETVCEIGFNTGHSALLWLASGAQQVLSFELGQYPYSAKAVGWLSERFPNRLQVIMGDSSLSVPAYTQWWPLMECNLLFVDGGHLYHHALGDLQNFRAMANQTFHYLLVDDTEQGEVATAWRDYQSEGGAVETEVVVSAYSEAYFTHPDGRIVADPDHVKPAWRSSISFGSYIF